MTLRTSKPSISHIRKQKQKYEITLKHNKQNIKVNVFKKL